MLLKTERLTIEIASEPDLPFLLKLLNSEGWLKYIGDRNVHTLEEAEVYYSTRWVGRQPVPHCGMYIIKLHDGTRVGTNSLVQRDFLDTVDIGYAFLDEHGGKGYATEATRAFLQYVNETLGYQRVLAFALTEHRASLNVLEKLGFIEKDRFIDTDEECVLMEWEKR